MTESDEERWDARYAAGAYAERTHPSAYVKTVWERLCLRPPVRACDVACGAGRNAIYLAQQGCEVDGLDVSGVALGRARERAEALGMHVEWHRLALLAPGVRLPGEGYQLITMVRFVANDLLTVLCDALAPGGYLLIEAHLQWPEDIALSGPSSARFRLPPGELEQAIADIPSMEIQEAYEGLIDEVDGSRGAVARLLARRQTNRVE